MLPSARAKVAHLSSFNRQVVHQAVRGHVYSIDARRSTLSPEVAQRVVPELLGAGCSLLELKLDCMKLNGTWVVRCAP